MLKLKRRSPEERFMLAAGKMLERDFKQKMPSLFVLTEVTTSIRPEDSHLEMKAVIARRSLIACEHKWKATKNDVISDGEWCPACGAIRPSDAKAPSHPKADHSSQDTARPSSLGPLDPPLQETH